MPPKKSISGNPQWAQWLRERAEELERARPGDKLAKTFGIAAKSVEKNPVPIPHPMDTTVLHGIGKHVAGWLTKRLQQECEETGQDMPERTMQITAGAAAAKKHSKKQLALRAVGGESDDDEDDEPRFAPGEFVGGINAPRDANAYASAGSSSEDEAPKPPRKTAKASTSAQAGRRLGGLSSDDEGAGAGAGAGAGKGKAKAKPTKKPINTSSPAKPKAKTKGYCPRVQTGGWAILVGLCAFGSGEWKSQDEIVVVADPFYGKAGQSLNDKGTGSGPQKFITAWKSMKKLIDEGLVEKKSRNPVLYQLTYDGWKMARRACRHAKAKLREIEESSNLPDFPASSSEDGESEDDEPQKAQKGKAKGKTAAKTAEKASTKGKGKAREVVSSDKEPVAAGRGIGNRQIAAGVSARARDRSNSRDWLTAPDAPFLFSYLGEGDRRVSKMEEAEVQMDESFTPVYLIEFLPSQASRHAMFKSGNVWGEHVPVHRDTVGPEGKTLCAYLKARVAPPRCSGFDALHASIGATNEADKERRGARESEKENSASSPKRATSGAGQQAAKKTKTGKTVAGSKGKAKETIELESSEDEGPPPPADPREAAARAAERRAFASRPSASASASQATTSAAQASLLPPAGSSRRASSTFRLPSNVASSGSSRLPDVYALKTTSMPPGSYTIHLVVDSREKPGLNNKRLERMLTDQGVSWESRMLAMGDFIWIAKCKNTKREVVLDCCLERKRLDDLVSSIKDGRYIEQKARMQRSGITRLMYLVEEHDSQTQHDTYGVAISTVKSSLQVSDGIHVHMVKTVADACAYLAMLTKTFTELHKHTTLTVLADEVVSRDTYLDLITQLRSKRAGTSFFISYSSYSQINAKLHNVHGGWAKMIASTNGMSLERSQIFIDRFPSPGLFLEELNEVYEEEKEKEKALDAQAQAKRKRTKGTDGECWIMRQTVNSDQDGLTVRPIGQALSTHMWNLFTAKEYPKPLKGSRSVVED